LGGVADVGAERGDLVTFASQLGDELVGCGLVGDVVDRDRRAVGGQPPYDRRADATTAARHQCPLARESCVSGHRILPNLVLVCVL